jgi:hypothetical protein
MKDIKPINTINTILCNLTDKVGYNEEDGSHKLAFFDAIEKIIDYLRSLKHTGDNPTDDIRLQGYYDGYNQALQDIEKSL